MNKEIEINFKELERSISQMEFETNSIKIPDLKQKLLNSIDNNKARYEQLKKEISNEKNNELTVQSIQQSKKEKNEITIEVSSDDNNEDKYTIKNVGVFISLIHKVKRKINDPQLINQIKSINIKYILIAIFIFLLIFITLCFKIKRSNIFF